jgi:hypothetical protein
MFNLHPILQCVILASRISRRRCSIRHRDAFLQEQPSVVCLNVTRHTPNWANCRIGRTEIPHYYLIMALVCAKFCLLGS